jgi:hypothetical protein
LRFVRASNTRKTRTDDDLPLRWKSHSQSFPQREHTCMPSFREMLALPQRGQVIAVLAQSGCAR